MPELDDRIAAALRAAGDQAPDATGLVGSARRRASARRRRTTGVAAAACLAVVAVAGGTAMLTRGGDGGSTQAADQSPSPSVGAPSQVGRVETWRDASVMVPPAWGYGPLTTWCTQGSTPGAPVVDRAGGVVESIACDPSQGYGVQFLDPKDFDFAKTEGQVWQYHRADVAVAPEGAWLGYRQTQHAVVSVIMPTREQAESVLASFEQVGTADANGCPPKAADDFSILAAPVDGVLLCRYAGDHWLEQSEVLTGADAVSATAALDAAPEGPVMSCPAPPIDDPAVLETVDIQSGQDSALLRAGYCPGLYAWHGVLRREITADVLHWVMSPGWSGTLPAGVTGYQPRQ